eukprot:1180396-Prorocentrum_minimum.AAC.6
MFQENGIVCITNARYMGKLAAYGGEFTGDGGAITGDGGDITGNGGEITGDGGEFVDDFSSGVGLVKDRHPCGGWLDVVCM